MRCRSTSRTAEHERTAPAGLVGRARDQRRLADPGLAGDQYQAAVTLGRPVDLGAQQPGRVVPPDHAVASRSTHASTNVSNRSDGTGRTTGAGV